MAKPDTPGELKDVEVKAVSLVGKAANKKKFAIFKSADYIEEGGGTVSEEAEGTREKKFFDVVKAFFTGEKDIEAEKGALRDEMVRRERAQKFDNAFWALNDVIRQAGHKSGKLDIKTVSTAIKEFSAICEEMAGDEGVIKECCEEIQKSGRKVSGARLRKLREAHASIAEIIAEAEGNGAEGDGNENGEGSEVTKEDVQAVLKEALEPIEKRMEAIEKEKETESKQTAEPENMEDGKAEFAALLKAAVAPIEERLAAIEKARGISNRIPEDNAVEKREGGDFWGGSLLGVE
jgi:hypothetical protein